MITIHLCVTGLISGRLLKQTVCAVDQSCDRFCDPENDMKVIRLVGIGALLLGSAGASGAQTPANPGELVSASDVGFARSAFDSGVDPSPVLPRHDIATVEDKHDRRVRTIWIASIFAMAAGTTADAVSSWHKQESNSLLASSNGTFGGRGVGLKVGIAAGVLAPQIIFRKRKDWRTAFAVGNFAEAGIFTGAAIHNAQVK
jgi:hypothetical protein